jgi:hypothetical protein
MSNYRLFNPCQPCCSVKRPREVLDLGYVPRGGVVVGGGTTLVKLFSHFWKYRPTGGVTVGGTGVVKQKKKLKYVPVGGVVVDGTVSIKKIVHIKYVPAGGVVVDGSGDAYASHTSTKKYYIPDGGVVVGGQASVKKIAKLKYLPTGGVLVGGEATEKRVHISKIKYVPDGGVVVGGSGAIPKIHTAHYYYIPEGGVVVGGEPTQVKLGVGVFPCGCKDGLPTNFSVDVGTVGTGTCENCYTYSGTFVLNYLDKGCVYYAGFPTCGTGDFPYQWELWFDGTDVWYFTAYNASGIAMAQYKKSYTEGWDCFGSNVMDFDADFTAPSDCASWPSSVTLLGYS